MKNTLKRIFDMLKYRIPAIIIAAAMLAACVPPIEAKADTSWDDFEITTVVIPEGTYHIKFKSNDTISKADVSGPLKETVSLSSMNTYSNLHLNGNSGMKVTIDVTNNSAEVYDMVAGDTITAKVLQNKKDNKYAGINYYCYVLDTKKGWSRSTDKQLYRSMYSEAVDKAKDNEKYAVYCIRGKVDDSSKDVNGAIVTVAYPNAWGTTSGDKQSQEATVTTLKAEPKPGYKFDHWEHNGDPVSTKPTFDVDVKSSLDAYVAIFVKNDDACGVFTASSGDGTTSGDTYLVDNGTVNTSTIINAYPKDNNTVFQYWKRKTRIPGATEYTDDETFISYSSSLNVNIDRHRDIYTAYFESKDKVAGVFTTVEGKGTTTGDACRYNGQLVDQTTITATPEKDYEFQYWKKDSDTEPFSYLPTINVPVTDKHTTYTAYFVERKEANGVTTTASPSNGGTTSGDTLRVVNGQKVNSTTIVAYPNDGYVFDHWGKKVGTEQETNYSTSASVTVKVDDSKTEYIAYFKTNDNGVTTTANPSQGGTTSGDTLRVVNGQKVNSTTIVAYPNDGYVFDHWGKSVDGETETRFSTTASVSVNVGDNKTVYTAYFKANDNGVTTIASPSEWGTTSGDTLRVVNGQKVSSTTIVAYPNDGYVFDHWGKSVDGGTETRFSTTASVSVNVGDNKTVYTAYFKVEKDGNGVFTEPDDVSHGTTSGDTLRVVNGQKINQTTITAYPSSNEWIFDYWTVTTSTVTNQRVSNANPFTVAVTDERKVYTAHFRERGSTTKEKVNITGHSTGATSKIDKTKDREFTSAAVGVDSGIMVAKAGDAVDSSRSRLSSDTVRNPVNVGVERLNDTLVVNEKKTSEGLKSEEFRLLAGDGNEIVLEDAAASGYEDAKAAAEEQVAKKYGQYYKAEVMLVCNTQIPGGYTDGKQTFVWSGTGAKKGERLMIIQQCDGEKDKIITPVADDDGVLTFSAPVIGSSRLILVRAVTKK